MKIRPVGAEFFLCGWADGQADRRTDLTKLIVAFRNFANASENVRLKWTTSVDWSVHVPFSSVPFKTLSQSEISEQYEK